MTEPSHAQQISGPYPILKEVNMENKEKESAIKGLNTFIDYLKLDMTSHIPIEKKKQQQKKIRNKKSKLKSEAIAAIQNEENLKFQAQQQAPKTIYARFISISDYIRSLALKDIFYIIPSFLGSIIVFIAFGLSDDFFFGTIYNDPNVQQKLLDHGMTLSSFSILVGGIASAIGLMCGKLIDFFFISRIKKKFNMQDIQNPSAELISEMMGLLSAAFIYVAIASSKKQKKKYHIVDSKA